MKTVVLIAGIPGVGKSTLAHKVAEKAKGAVLDVDVFKRKFADPSALAEQIDPPNLRWKYYEATLGEAFQILEAGTSMVVIDEVFHLKELRGRIEAMCEEREVRVLWVEVLCPYDLVEQRIRAKERVGHILSTEKTLEMYRRFEEVFEVFEGKGSHITVTNDGKSIEELVGVILAGV